MELTGNVQGLIDLVGGGSDVEFEQILESGEKIGVITIDNVPTDIYAPEGAEVTVTQVLSSGTKIASIEVDGESVDLYAPTPEEPTSVEVTQVLSSGTKIASIDVDGDSTDIYAPEGGSTIPDYSTNVQSTGQKWIDGSDIKFVTLIHSLTSGVYYIDLTSLNIEHIIKCESICYTSAGNTIVLPYYENSNFKLLNAYDGESKRMTFALSYDLLNAGYTNIQITLYYTETTT